MNFTSRGHLPKETRKHVTSAGDNIIIFCFFVIEGDTAKDLRYKWQKKKKTPNNQVNGKHYKLITERRDKIRKDELIL